MHQCLEYNTIPTLSYVGANMVLITLLALLWDSKKLNVVWCRPASLPWEGHYHPWTGVLLFLLLHPLQAQQKQWPRLAEHRVPEWVRNWYSQTELKAFLRLQCSSTHLWSCPAATPTLAVVVVSRWCLWPVADAFTMAPSSMSCSTLWDSTTNRPVLTGTTTSKSCWKTFSLVMEPFIIPNGVLEREPRILQTGIFRNRFVFPKKLCRPHYLFHGQTLRTHTPIMQRYSRTKTLISDNTAKPQIWDFRFRHNF